MTRLKVILVTLALAVTMPAIADPKITRAPYFSEPKLFERIGVEIQTDSRRYPAATDISRERLSEVLMAKGYQVVDLALVAPEMRSGLAIMKVGLNQIEVRKEANEKRKGGGWLGEQNRKYGASHFYYLKGNLSVSVVAADTGSRLWMASSSAKVSIEDDQSWDQGLLKMLQDIIRHYPGIDDLGVSIDDKVLSNKVCGGFLSKTAQCKVGGSDVRLIRQISDEPCIKDVNWQFADGVISTKDGCRADFAVIE